MTTDKLNVVFLVNMHSKADNAVKNYMSDFVLGSTEIIKQGLTILEEHVRQLRLNIESMCREYTQEEIEELREKNEEEEKNVQQSDNQNQS